MTHKKAGTKAPGKKQPAAQPEKRVYFKQSDFPLVTLQQAQKIASALVDNFGGGSASPPDCSRPGNQSDEQLMAKPYRRGGRVWVDGRRLQCRSYKAPAARPETGFSRRRR